MYISKKYNANHLSNCCPMIIRILCIFGYFGLINVVEAQDNPLLISGSLILTNNGIDPVPAFALGKPALMSQLELNKKNFIYINQLNIAVADFKPWSQTNWFLYKIPVSKKGFFRTGLAFSYFHKRDKLDFPTRPNTETQILNRYLAFELSYHHQFSDRLSMSLTNWMARGIEWDAVRHGNFTNLGAFISNLISGKFTIHLAPNLFYVTNAAPFKGWFTSANVWLYYKKIPLGLTGQFVLPLDTDPPTDKNWNIGLIYKY